MSATTTVDTTGARRNTNKHNALLLVGAGLAVFPSSGKVPLVPRFNKLDTELTKDDREAAAEKYESDHDGKRPIHVGATRNKDAINKMWRAFPDAVPSISCGPSNLVVLDSDIKDNGPEKIDALFAEHGGTPEAAPVIPSRSGGKHTVFSDPDSIYTNKAGLLKKQYGTDVRGNGGQFVAPGSIREDGKTYGTKADLKAFLRAYAHKTIPPLPEFVSELIGQSPEGEAPLNDSDPQIKTLIKRLQTDDWPDFTATFDATLGRYCLECLHDRSPDFKDLYTAPGDDRSTNRFNAARFLIALCPGITVLEYAAFCEAWDGAGDYNERQLAREFAKAQDSPAVIPSLGNAFEPVDDEDDEPVANRPEDAQSFRQPKTAYIEDIRTAEPRYLDWSIKYFIARGTTSVVSGMWGAGKTAVFLDVGLHIAHGLEYRGRKVTKGVVVYCALENSDDVERRVRAWCEMLSQAGHDVSSGAFVIHRGPCGLFRSDGKPTKDEKELIKIAQEAAEHYSLPVSMIVIDTLSQSIAPGSDREDGGIYTAAMQRISIQTGANVTALHHPTKAGVAVRGDSQLQGNVDTLIDVSREERTGRGVIKAGSKYRIGDPNKVRFGYRLKAVEVGRDDDGDIIDVVLAVPDHGPDMPVADGDEDDVPPSKVPDRREDRVAMLLEVVREQAEKAAAEGEPLSEVALTAQTVREALNARRAELCGIDGVPLQPLDRKGVMRVAATAVESGGLAIRKQRYFLVE